MRRVAGGNEKWKTRMREGKLGRGKGEALRDKVGRRAAK